MIIMDKINDSEIKNAPPQNGNIANSNKLQNIREIHPIIKNLWFISILNFKLIFHKYFEQYGLQSKASNPIFQPPSGVPIALEEIR